MEVIDPQVTLPTLVAFQDTPEARLLPSTGITRLRRYYEPLRRPQAARPVPRGRPVGSRTHRLGFPVLPGSPYAYMPSSLPRQNPEAAVAQDPTSGTLLLSGWQPSPCHSGVGFCIKRFEASMTFTFVTACTLAEAAERPFASKASTVSLPPRLLRLLPAGAKVAGWD
jgi:hypothetical protein